MKDFIKKINLCVGIIVVLLFALQSAYGQVVNNQEMNVSTQDISIPKPDISVFKHKVTPKNRSISERHITYIDNDIVNEGLIFVSHDYGESNIFLSAPICVMYSNDKWAIVSMDKTPIRLNTEFNVMVVKRSSKAFVVELKKTNVARIKINHPDLNNNPDAKFLINQVAIKIPYGEIYSNPNPVGVTYSKGFWYIYNTNIDPFENRCKFNILIHQDIFEHNSKATKMFGYTSNINTNHNANTAIFTTFNSKNEMKRNYNYFGVWHSVFSKKWSIITENKDLFKGNETFNVLAIPFPITHTTIIKPLNLNKNQKVKKNIQKIDSTSLKTNTNQQFKKNKIGILSLQKNDSTSSSHNSTNKESFVQIVMRESYSSHVADLKNYAAKIKSLNQKKKSLREKILKEHNKIDANLLMMDYVTELKTFKTELLLAISEKLNEKYISSNKKISKIDMEKEFDIIVPLLIKQMTYSYPSYEKTNHLNIPKQVPDSDVTSHEDLNLEIDFWTKKIRTLIETQDSNMNYSKNYLDMQNAMQEENRVFSMLTNIFKTTHETSKSIINNMKN